MSSTIKVVKKNITGWTSLTDFNEDELAIEIQTQESMGWILISSFAVKLKALRETEAIVLIYRKK